MDFVRYNWFCRLCNINSRMNFVRYNWFCKLCLLIYFVWSDLHAVSVKSTSQILKSENFLPTQWCKSSDSIIKNFHRCILHYKVNVLLKDTHHQRKKSFSTTGKIWIDVRFINKRHLCNLWCNELCFVAEHFRL